MSSAKAALESDTKVSVFLFTENTGTSTSKNLIIKNFCKEPFIIVVFYLFPIIVTNFRLMHTGVGV